MFNKLRKLFSKKQDVVTEPTPPVVEVKVEEKKVEEVKKKRKPKPKPKVESKSSDTNLDKEAANLSGEPYINILKVEIDPNNINNGAFELDWNDKFVLNLIRAGYKIREDDTDQQIVDRWFQTVCRNIALEIYEQEQADPMKRDDIRIIRSRDIGNGRSEVS